MSTLCGKRVLFVLSWADLGGAERDALALAEQLRSDHGAEVEVLALTAGDGTARRLFTERGIPWQANDLQWYGSRVKKARTLSRLARRLRARRPEVLMPYCTPPNVLCGLIWRWTGATVCVWNQQDVNPSRRFGPSVIRRSLDRTPLVLANSWAAQDFLVSDLGARPERVRVVLERHERVEALDGRASWRSRLDLGTDVVTACMAAHLHEYKDHATLLRAWRLVLDRKGGGSRPVLLLAGRPAGTEDALKALAFDLELGDAVRFLGEVRDIGGLLEASDIGVLSSPRESRPHAVLECMAAGLPVAATDIPGIRELFAEEGSRFLAPPGDAERLAAILLELVTSPELRSAVGQTNARLSRESLAASGGPEAAAALVAEALRRAKHR
jgi:glycosyltransferase involved in cell wall biosynthesis